MTAVPDRLILIALPDRSIADALVEELAAEPGRRGLAVEDADAALAWARALRPNLVVTSLDLPGAERLIAALLADSSRPIVALSRPGAAGRRPADGVDVIEQPVGTATLADYVGRAVALGSRASGTLTRS
jgi:DNA-binding response OmpR family regulator